MEKNIILVIVAIVFLITCAILLIVRGQWLWGVALFLLVLVNIYWRITHRKWISGIYKEKDSWNPNPQKSGFLKIEKDRIVS